MTFFAQLLFQVQQGTFARPLVDHVPDFVGPDISLAGFQRTMNLERLLAMEDFHPVDFKFRLFDPGTGVRDDVGHCRKYFQAFLIGILQVALILWV
ncbi:hypothetical protein D3C73_1390490 [compost metagenome]